MKKTIDIDTWKRKEHFLFFEKFEEPFYGVTANVDATKAYAKAKESGKSFFLYYLYQSLKAVNSIEELRCRLEDGKPVCYDIIHGSSTVLNADDLFSFAFLPFADSFEVFYEQAAKEVERIKTLHGIGATEENGRPDLIHYSTLPWVSFTSLSHERCFSRPDSIPKITFGKLFEDRDRLLMPVSIHTHHGLVDGFHVGLFYERFQELMNA